MSTPPPQPARKSAGDGKKVTPPTTSIVTRNGARKAKIQTRAMATGAKPSAVVVAAKKKAQQKKKHNIEVEIRDHYQIAMESKAKIKGPTGLVTEPRMADHKCLWDDKYPECPERLISVINRCHELNLITECKQYSPRPATKEKLAVLHSDLVYEMMETTHNNKNLDYLEDLSSKFDAIYIHPSTHELALIAAGSTIDMVDRVVSGEVQNAAALVRPPGHHAMRSEPCGYCFYNNVALAAKHALDTRGLNRILIVDWDVHHGQATQQMFYNDPRVVYFSIHRYEHGSFWPNLRQSDFHYVGSEAGKGYNFNVPLNTTGMTDGDYIAIWQQLLLPMAFEYQPELILISAGYDAAVGCPEGEMEVTPACYATLTHMLMGVCSSVCVVLEGGYCLASLAEGAALTLRTLLGHPPPRLSQIQPPCDSIRETILNCIYAHRRYWNCYNYQLTYTTQGAPNVCDRQKEKHTVLVRWEGDETRPERFQTRDCYPLQDDATKRRIAEKLNHLRIVTDLTLPKHAVCYVYDQAMLKHKNICEPGHVECPERIMRIHERHRDYGLLDRMLQLSARSVTDEDILAVHTEEHLDRLKALAKTKLRDLKYQKEEFDSVYFHPDTLESASIAAGCVLQAVDTVMTGISGGAVCVVRPPGHHADEDTPSGFCLLNNAAIAAKYAVNTHGADRVLLIDWDVHHGNGTQRITYQDNKILYISLHRYDNGSFFPHSKEADYTAVGEGRGEGYNVNIPWNKRGMGDTEYLAAFTQVVLPIAYEYNPQLVIISAGFDACVGDPLGGCKVSPECYGRMTHLLAGLAGGRVILCLEGGYNVTSISYAMTMCTKALLKDPLLHHYEARSKCHWSAIESINNVIETHKKYWKSLRFQVALPSEEILSAPLPSRGLDMYELSVVLHDIDSSKDDKSIDSRSSSQLESSLEVNLASLSLDGKCSDGIHCGTDDEDDEKNASKTSNDPAKNSENIDIFKCPNLEADQTSCTQRRNPIDKDKKDVFKCPNLEEGQISCTKPMKGIKNDVSSSSKSFDSSPEVHKSEQTSCTRENQNIARKASNKSISSKTSNNSETSAKHSNFDKASNTKANQNEDIEMENETCSPDCSSYKCMPCSDIKANQLSQKEKDKLTLVDYLAENIQAIVDGEMFAVIPLPWCPHLDSLYAIPSDVKFEQSVKCIDCESTEENWVCLHCYVTACARSVNGHMQAHCSSTGHALVLSLIDLSVWCNICDAYVDNALLYDAKNNAHRCKFGEDMPWCYKDDTIHMD